MVEDFRFVKKKFWILKKKLMTSSFDTTSWCQKMTSSTFSWQPNCGPGSSIIWYLVQVSSTKVTIVRASRRNADFLLAPLASPWKPIFKISFRIYVFPVVSYNSRKKNCWKCAEMAMTSFFDWHNRCQDFGRKSFHYLPKLRSQL